MSCIQKTVSLKNSDQQFMRSSTTWESKTTFSSPGLRLRGVILQVVHFFWLLVSLSYRFFAACPNVLRG